MNLNSIQWSAYLDAAASGAKKISAIAVEYLGKTYEWLQINVPIAVNAMVDLSLRVWDVARPHLATIGTWAVENKELLTAGAVGVVIGVTIASLVYRLCQKKTA